MRNFTALDYEILNVARTLFLKNGIVKTEMKDIAQKLGCSRSTLYRHFASKEEILFELAQEGIQVIADAIKIPTEFRFMCGFDELEWQMNSLVESLISNVEVVTFLRDFDCLYTEGYPDISLAKDFEHNMLTPLMHKDLIKSYTRGVEDNSIKKVEEPKLLLLTLMHGCVAMAQRILPREKQYIIEHGYGQEILRNQMKLMLQALRNN